MVQILKKIQKQQIKGELFIIKVPGTCVTKGPSEFSYQFCTDSLHIHSVKACPSRGARLTSLS